MDKKEIAEFFDSFAESWDKDIIKHERKIKKILDVAEVTQNKKVLDVGCGTGVLIPDYIERNVAKCIAIDISANMIRIAESKFKNFKNIGFIHADAENFEFKEKFDCIIIYNAFPHFINRDILFDNLAKHLNDNGRITIAHSMSRDALIKHHSGIAEKVSTILPEADELAEIMKPYYNIDTRISNEEIYVVSGIKH